jgi:hypothetical protein
MRGKKLAVSSWQSAVRSGQFAVRSGQWAVRSGQLQSNFVLMNFQLFIANSDNIAPGDAIAISYITWFLSNFALHCYIEGNL